MISSRRIVTSCMFLILMVGCNAGNLEIGQSTAARIPVNMASKGKVEITVNSPTLVECYWADKELANKISSGKFLSPYEMQDAIASHMVVQNQREFTETVELPEGESFIYIQASGMNAPNKFSITYSVKKL